MSVASGLVRFSAVAFALIGAAYLVVPGTMLSVVGMASTPGSDFLMRTEGVALVSAGAFLWAAREARTRVLRVVLGALGFYYVVGSIVDLAAFKDGIVGSASVPSGAIRIAVGVACLLVALGRDGPPLF